jgi:MFS family permease
VTTDIPGRLDRLPWSRWHWTVVAGLGITWILDGLEVTVVGAIGSRLQDRTTLALTATQVGGAATAYLIGAVIGALGFGEATDRFGRKRLFLITLGWYITFTVGTALAWDATSFIVFRALTGMGIGGEYSAINSTIDELIPARRRGVVDIAINGSWWLGTLLGSAESIVLLDPRLIDQQLGWRLAFGLGAVLGVVVLFIRNTVPESPRWLLMHDRANEAERIMRDIEGTVGAQSGTAFAAGGARRVALRTGGATGLSRVARVMIREYPQRTLVALTLMITQAFLYNAIFFTEALVLTTFFGVDAGKVGYYIFPFAIGNLLGPLVLGGLFDTLGRRTMVAATYGISALLLAATSVLFLNGRLDALGVTLCWSVIFFFASAGASAAYLTVSEIFPLETRAIAIAIVYAVGTLVGGALAPALFGALIATKSPKAIVAGYAIGAAAMLTGAIVQAIWGVDAERKMLEDISAPLGSPTA